MKVGINGASLLAADVMDKQYMEIREARKNLFELDKSEADCGCEIDIERWRFDERIVWHVDEPDTGPGRWRCGTKTMAKKYRSLRRASHGGINVE
jgi:hypothetical protein